MARGVITTYHYSGKVDTRSQIHLGVFYKGRCGGAIQLGPPIDKRKVLGTVAGTQWHELLDLHRLAFADWLPRNSESRALAMMVRIIRKRYPWIKWVQSYADGTQCGDGTIYRAAGFHLIGIRENRSMYRLPDGKVACKIVFEPGFASGNPGKKNIKTRYGKTGSETAGVFLKRIGAVPLKGFQLRYIYFLQPECKAQLTVPILPYDEIAKRGAAMYLGKSRAGSIGADAPSHQDGEGGSTPTPALR